MKIRINNKGYTLIEILAAVSILAILMAIAISGYTGIMKKVRQRYYEKQEELVIQAGREYFNDNHNQLPVTPGETKCVLLNTLISNKYIDKVKDYDKKDCNGEESKVCATKLNKTKYLYTSELKCSNKYKSLEYKTPIIIVDPKESNNITMDLDKEKDVTATIKYDPNTESDKEESNLTSYRYIIYKKNNGIYEVYSDSNWLGISGSVKQKNVKVTLKTTGTFYVRVWAYNEKGKLAEAKSGEVTLNVSADKVKPTINVTGYLMNKDENDNLYYINSNGQRVETREQAAIYNFGTWSNKYVRVFVDGEDNESGLTDNSEVFIKEGSATSSDNQNVWKLCSETVPRSYTVQAQGSSDLKFRNTDRAGNTQESDYVNVKLDRKGPKFTIESKNDSDGEITLTASNITDDLSGVKEYSSGIDCQYRTYTTVWSNWINCEKGNTVKISSSDIKNVTLRTRDNAGNTSEKTETIKNDDSIPEGMCNTAPIGANYFGNEPLNTEENVGNKVDTSAWGQWCYYTWGDGPYYKNTGYDRICYSDACGRFKGWTATKINNEIERILGNNSCNFYRAWCFRNK